MKPTPMTIPGKEKDRKLRDSRIPEASCSHLNDGVETKR
jgi:hypothetical protein